MTGNMLHYLPKPSQPKAKQGLHLMSIAETRDSRRRTWFRCPRLEPIHHSPITDRLERVAPRLSLPVTDAIKSAFDTIRYRDSLAKRDS